MISSGDLLIPPIIGKWSAKLRNHFCHSVECSKVKHRFLFISTLAESVLELLGRTFSVQLDR